MDELIYWIWLSLSCTSDTATFPKLISEFKDAKEIYDADIKKISACIGYKSSDRTHLADKNLDRAKEIYRFCTTRGVGLLPYCDEKYPKSLRSIPTPPVLLYYRGKLPDFDSGIYIAAVGTRSLSDYGRKTAFKVSYDLAAAGATIVSGMAIGIDGVALSGALSAGRSTIAVIGSGIDVCYPQGHLRLAREIVKNGCILTEYAPGTKPDKYNFPKRNRIISGLSAATLVIEGRERSGALITARRAMEQNRAVYALPGNVGSQNSEATNLLIKNGAKIFTKAEDIINDFESIYRGKLNPFNLKERCPVDMIAALREYEVIAVCPGDDIFIPSRKKQSFVKTEEAQRIDSAASEPCVQEPPPSFDSASLKLYKKIPLTGDCTIESLIDSQMSLRDVMKNLLKLEMGHFVVMLPGEKVARKSK